MTPCVSIITITMNHLYHITEMLRSLFTTGKPLVTFEVIIVDNRSTDGTVQFIKTHYPGIKVIENTQVYGFAQNNNIGVQEAAGEYVLILNPDIIVKPGSIDKLYEFAKRNPSCGIVAPRLLNTDGTLQYSARRFLSPTILLNRFLTKGDDESNNKNVSGYLMKNLPMDSPSDVDWCMGAALLLSNHFYNELGGFDAKFFLYIEDMDLCHRCWKKKKRVTYYPLSAFIHVHKRESRSINKKTWTHLKSFIYFLKKNGFKLVARPSIKECYNR